MFPLQHVESRSRNLDLEHPLKEGMWLQIEVTVSLSFGELELIPFLASLPLLEGSPFHGSPWAAQSRSGRYSLP